MKQVMPKPHSHKPTSFISLKSISTFKTKKSLMKPDTFNFKSHPTFPATTKPLSALLTCF